MKRYKGWNGICRLIVPNSRNGALSTMSFQDLVASMMLKVLTSAYFSTDVQ